MSTQILMPALSPTMTEGKLSRWLKHIGDEVRAGDVIAEIETDKATMEVEAVDEGKLAQILVDEGTDGVAVNTPIAVLAGNGEDLRVESPGQACRRPPRSRRHVPKLRRRSRGQLRPLWSPHHGRSRTRIGVRPSQSPCARHCVMRWPPNYDATTKYS